MGTYTQCGDPPDWSPSWENRTVFLGNFLYTTTAAEITQWVQLQVFPLSNHDTPLFRVRCERGGKQGDHGSPKKIFKLFAFLHFEFARDARILLEKFRKEGGMLHDRHIVSYPCILAGSWMFVNERWIPCKNWWPVNEQDRAELLESNRIAEERESNRLAEQLHPRF